MKGQRTEGRGQTAEDRGREGTEGDWPPNFALRATHGRQTHTD